MASSKIWFSTVTHWITVAGTGQWDFFSFWLAMADSAKNWVTTSKICFCTVTRWITVACTVQWDCCQVLLFNAELYGCWVEMTSRGRVSEGSGWRVEVGFSHWKWRPNDGDCSQVLLFNAELYGFCSVKWRRETPLGQWRPPDWYSQFVFICIMRMSARVIQS